MKLIDLLDAYGVPPILRAAVKQICDENEMLKKQIEWEREEAIRVGDIATHRAEQIEMLLDRANITK